jgi:hypothetical protein
MCITRKVLPEDTEFPCEKLVVDFLNITGYAGGLLLKRNQPGYYIPTIIFNK